MWRPTAPYWATHHSGSTACRLLYTSGKVCVTVYTFVGARREWARTTTERTCVSKISPHFWKKEWDTSRRTKNSAASVSRQLLVLSFPSASVLLEGQDQINRDSTLSRRCVSTIFFFFFVHGSFVIDLLCCCLPSHPHVLSIFFWDFLILYQAAAAAYFVIVFLAVSRQIVLFRLSSWSETTGRCHVLNSLALSSSLFARIVLFSSSSPSSGFSSFIPHRPSTRCGLSGELSTYNPIAIGVEMRLSWTKTNRSWLWQQSPQSVRVWSVCFCKRHEPLKTFLWWIWTFTTRLFFPSLWSKRPLSSWATDYWWWRLSDIELCSTPWTVTSVPCASPDSSPELSFHSVSATMSGKGEKIETIVIIRMISNCIDCPPRRNNNNLGLSFRIILKNNKRAEAVCGSKVVVVL